MTEQVSLLREVVPICTKCRSSMVLRRLHAGRLNNYAGRFECLACGHKLTKPIELALPQSPPLAARDDFSEEWRRRLES